MAVGAVAVVVPWVLEFLVPPEPQGPLELLEPLELQADQEALVHLRSTYSRLREEIQQKCLGSPERLLRLPDKAVHKRGSTQILWLP